MPLHDPLSRDPSADRYCCWCPEGCGFVEDLDHRCEQWCHTLKIPAEAVEQIQAAEIERCAKLVEGRMNKTRQSVAVFNSNQALWNAAAAIRASLGESSDE